MVRAFVLLYGVFVIAACPTVLFADVPTPDHVVVVIEENRSDSQVYGDKTFPFFNGLAKTAAKFTDYVGITHPSEPNYLALFAGTTLGVKDDNVHSASTFANASNLGAKLLKAGKTFVGYSEDLPSNGSQASTSGNYARKHNPWANWQDASIAAANRLPSSVNRGFAGSGNFPALDFSQLPDVSFVVPNLNNDGHDTSNDTADNWLNNNMSGYMKWANTHNSLLIITWDEDEGTGRLPTMFLGPMVKPGVYNEKVNHYSLLRTLEDMYGLSHDTSNTQNATTISDVFALLPASVPEPGGIALVSLGVISIFSPRKRRVGESRAIQETPRR